MNDTLDGMTVEQLDDLIKRAEATKRKVEESCWIVLPPQLNSMSLVRVNKITKEMQYEDRIDGWTNLPNHTKTLQYAYNTVATTNDQMNIANAIIALSK